MSRRIRIRIRIRPSVAVTVVALGSLVACGAERPAQEPSAVAAPESARQQQGAAGYPPPGHPTAPSQTAVPQPGQPGTPPSGMPVIPGMSPASPARSERVRAFYQHGVELDQAASDCKSACRALGAMDRAAGELCEIDGHDGICKDAEGRVRDARDKVRGACGTCPDGVVLEREAPIPGRR